MFSSFANAADDPLHSYKDYLIIMVHGIGANYKTWAGQYEEKDSAKLDKLYEYLCKEVKDGGLGCSRNVFVYSFSDPYQYIKQEMLELGNADFKNPAGQTRNDADKAAKFQIDKQQRCWIEQARYDYAKRIADSNKNFDDANDVLTKRPDLIPKKILFICHSMGNFAVRGYIMSDELAARGLWGSEVKQGFYRDDVDKVVFIDSVLKGSETPLFVYINFWRANIEVLFEIVQNYATDLNVVGKDNTISNQLTGLGKDVINAYLAGITLKLMNGEMLSKQEADFVWLLIKTGLELKVLWTGVDFAIKNWDSKNGGISLDPTSFFKNLEKNLNELGSKVNPIEAYWSILKIGTDIASKQVAKDIVGLGIAHLFDINMFAPSFHGEYKGTSDKNALRGIDDWNDTLYEKGMPLILKDITLEGINQRYNKNYKPIKYSAIITDGSMETDADALKAATIADISGKVLNGLGINTSMGLNALGLNVTVGTDSAYTIATLLHPDFWQLKTTSAKVMSLLMSNFGAVAVKNGDFVVSKESQSGEGISELANMKRYNQRVYPERLEKYLNETLLNEATVVESTIGLLRLCAPQPDIIYGLLRYTVVSSLAIHIWDSKDEMFGKEKLIPHFNSVSHPNLPLVDQALYEPPSIKIDGMYRELKSNEIEAYNLPTPSTQAQRVALAPAPANNSEEGRAKWPNYVLVSTTNIPIPYGRAGGTPPQLIALQDTYYARITTFDYTVGANGDSSSSGGDTIQVYHPQLNKNVWAANLATKADSMILRGTLEDLTPRVGMTAEYSFNFAAWQPLPVVNDYGHFELPITLAEGQNIVTFREQNKAGYSGHQFLRIIKSSTPMLPQNMTPVENTAINNCSPTISVQFKNIQFESNPTTINFVDNFIVDGFEANGGSPTFTPLQVAYDYGTTSNLVNGFTLSTHGSGLSEGRHEVTARVHDAYGHTMQAIWPFWVDTTPPVIKTNKQELWISDVRARRWHAPEPQPSGITYTVSDNISEIVKNVTFSLKNNPDDVQAILSYPTNNLELLGRVEQTITLFDTLEDYSAVSPNGTYYFCIRAQDHAGNVARTIITVNIDSTPPSVTGCGVSPMIANRSNPNIELSGRCNEPAAGYTLLSNKNGKTYTFPLAVTRNNDGYIFTGSQSLQSMGLETGTYNITIHLADQAGNESVTALGTCPFIYDTSPPIVINAVANPYVLRDGTSTTVTFNITRDNYEEAQAVVVEVYVEDLQSGAVTSVNSDNNYRYTPPLNAYGTYRYVITATDVAGNSGRGYSEFVKGGIKPEIVYPTGTSAHPAGVSGVTAIKGRALDPDWTNNADFAKYSIFYRPLPFCEVSVNDFRSSQLGGGWRDKETSGNVVMVPRENRLGAENVSGRPVSNYGVLGYINTSLLPPETYQIAVVVEETNGNCTVDVQVINVVPEPALSVSDYPSIDLDVPGNCNITDETSLTCSFFIINQPANVNVDIYNQSGQVVFHRLYSNIVNNDYYGTPSFEDKDSGIFIWKNEDGVHVEFRKGAQGHNYKGMIMNEGPGISEPLINFEVNTSSNEKSIFISGNPKKTTVILSEVDGSFDHFTSFTPYLFIGKNKKPLTMPMTTIDQSNSNVQQIVYNGRLPTGEYIPNGDYTVEARAEGNDRHIVTMNKPICLTTPLSKSVTKQPSGFDPTSSGLNYTQFGVKLNKTAYIRSFVKKQNHEVACIIEGTATTWNSGEHEVIWRGNSGTPHGVERVPNGTYYFEVQVAGEPEDFNVNNIRIVTSNPFTVYTAVAGNALITKINGVTVNEQNIVSPNSWYSVKLDIEGDLYEPLNYSYNLGLISARQYVRAYPYEPFALLAHRRFNQVNIFARGTHQGRWKRWEGVWNGKWHDKDFIKDQNYTQNFTRDKQEYFSPLNVFRATTEFGRYTNDPRWVGYDNVHLEFRDKHNSFALDTIDIEPIRISYPFQSYEEIYQEQTSANPTPIDHENPDPDEVARQSAARNEYERRKDAAISGTLLSEVRKYNNYKLKTSDKGIFKGLVLYIEEDQNIHTIFMITLEQPIEYSRLTNRFAPWYGYVRKGRRLDRDFKSLFNQPAFLGFPGNDFFSGPNIQASHNIDALSIAYPVDDGTMKGAATSAGTFHNAQEVADAIDAIKGSWGSSVVTDYYSYLSDEEFHMIPILLPGEKKLYEKNGNIFRSYDENTLINPLNTANSLWFSVSTNTEYDPRNQVSAYTFLWPASKSDIDAENIRVDTLVDNTFANSHKKTGITSLDNNVGNMHFYIVPDSRATDQSISKNFTGTIYYKDNNSSCQIADNVWTSLFSDRRNKGYEWRFVTDSITCKLTDNDPNDLISYKFSNGTGETNDTCSAIKSVIDNMDSWHVPWSPSMDMSCIAHSYRDINGLIDSGIIPFNPVAFSSSGINTLDIFKAVYAPQITGNVNSRLNDLFWKGSPFSGYQGDSTIQKNPFINIKSYSAHVYDLRGKPHNYLDPVPPESLDYNMSLQVKLKEHAKEQCWIPIQGKVGAPYTLHYFNDTTVADVFSVDTKDNLFDYREHCLGYIDAARLNGDYKLVIRTYNEDRTVSGSNTVPFSVGTPIDSAGGHVYSPYKRVHLYFPPQAVTKNTLITVTPLGFDEVKISGNLDIHPIGPLVEIKPAIASFNGNNKVTLEYNYTLAEAAKMIDQDHVDVGQLNIYYINPSGEVFIAKSQIQLEDSSTAANLKSTRINNSSALFGVAASKLKDKETTRLKISAELDHFSTYGMLQGAIPDKVQAFTSNDLVNTTNIALFGVQDFKKEIEDDILKFTGYYDLELYMDDRERFSPNTAKLLQKDKDYQIITYAPYQTKVDPKTDKVIINNINEAYIKKNFELKNVHLMSEGDNYLFITYATRNTGIINRPVTTKKITVDTIPPSFSVFSYDSPVFNPATSTDFKAYIRYDENVKLFVKLMDASGKVIIDDVKELAQYQMLALSWLGENQLHYKESAQSGKSVINQVPAEALPDGLYTITIFAIDKAGNVGENKVLPLILDRAPPQISNLDFDFSPWSVARNPRNTISFDLTDNVNKPIKQCDVYVGSLIRGSSGKGAANISKMINILNIMFCVPQGKTSITWAPTSNIPDGEYEIFLKVRDVADNELIVTRTILVDSTAPVISSPNLTSGRYSSKLNKENAISFIVSDNLSPADLSISVNILDENGHFVEGLRYYEGRGEVQFFITSRFVGNDWKDGNYYARISIQDKAGNRAERLLPFMLDNHAPEIKGAQLNTGIISSKRTNNFFEWSGNLWDAVSTTFNSRFFVEGNKKTVALGLGDSSAQVFDMLKGLTEGGHTITAEIRDLAGNMAIVTHSFIVDNTPPRIPTINLPVREFNFAKGPVSIFIAPADNFSSLVHVWYSLRRQATASSNVLFSQEKVVSGSDEIVFRGFDDNGQTMENGSYLVIVRIQDEAGNESITTTSLTIKNNKPLIVNVHLTGESLSFVSGIQDFALTFGVKSPEGVTISAVGINLYDSVKGLIATSNLKPGVQHNRQGEGAQNVRNYSVSLNELKGMMGGKNISGLFYFEMAAEDEYGVTTNEYVSFYIDNESPQIIEPLLEHSFFSRNYKSNNLTVSIKDNFSPTIDVAVTLQGREEQLVTKMSVTSAKRIVIEHSPTTSIDGTYSYILNCTDGNGNSVSMDIPFEIDNSAPSINSFQVENEVFSPDFDGDKDSIIWNISVSEPGTGYLYIYNKDNSLLKKLVETFVSGNKILSWNGMKETTTADNGTYNYTFKFMDRAGNTSATLARALDVKKGNVLISKISPSREYSSISNGVDLRFSLAEESEVEFVLRGDGISERKSGFVKFPAGANQCRLPDKLLTGLNDGTYNLVLIARNQQGKLSQEYSSILKLDVTSPKLSNISCKNTAFRPQTGEEFSVDFYLSEESQLTVKLEDSSLKVLDTIFDAKQIGKQHVTFSGYISKTLLAPGRYVFAIAAVDRAGNTVTERVSFECLAPVSPIEIKEVIAHNFSPNDDNVRDVSEIKVSYTGGSDTTKASIWIERDGKEFVRFVDAKGLDGRKYYSSWYGADSSGNKAKDGAYTLVVRLNDPVSEEDIRKEVQFVLVSELPTINCNELVEYFSPNGDSYQDTFNINVRMDGSSSIRECRDLSTVLRIKCVIADYAGNEIRTYEENMPPGNTRFTWDGTNVQGSAVPDGMYVARITACDSLGSISTVLNRDFFLDTTPPKIVAENNVFIQPCNGDMLTVSYNTNELTEGVITLLSASGPSGTSQVISNASGNWQERCELVPAHTITGNRIFLFDGKKDGVTTLPSGLYALKFQVIDQAGNRSGELTTFNIYEKMEAGLLCRDFTPNGDGLLDEVSVSWSITAGSGHYRQTLTLINKEGEAESAFAQFAIPYQVEVIDTISITAYALWNGSGTADGEYSLQLSVIDLITGEQQLITKSMTIASTMPTVSTREENIAFSPNGDGIRDFYTLDVSAVLSAGISESSRLSKKVSANYRVENNSGQVVYEQPEVYENNDRFTWNGRGNDFILACDGQYRVVVEATDTLGNKMNNLVRNIIVDTVKPVVPVVSTIDACTSLNVGPVNGQAEPGNTVRCLVLGFNSSQEYVAPVLLRPMGEGRDEGNGIFQITLNLTEGVNTISVVSIDSAGNVSATSNPESIIYDPVAPEITRIEYSDESPVKAGELIITVTYSEELNILPEIKIVNTRLELLPFEVRKSGKEVTIRFIIPATLAPQTINRLGALEGSNTVVIRNGRDYAQNIQNVCTGSITIDTTTPSIVVVDGYRSFIQTYKNQVLVVTYNVNEPVEETIILQGNSGGVWKNLSILSNKKEVQGTKTVAFDGMSGYGDELPMGLYGLNFCYVDQAGNRIEKMVTFSIYEKLETDLSCHDFTPNGDGLLDTMNIQWSIRGGSGTYRQTLELFNKAGKTDQEFGRFASPWQGVFLHDNCTPLISHFIWDGAHVDDGEYMLMVQVTDTITGEQQVVTRSISVASVVPTISFSEENSEFSPDLDGVKDAYQLDIYVNLSAGIEESSRLSVSVSADLTVINSSGQTVYENYYKFEKNNSFIWNGETSEGKKAADGKYTINLIGTDILGTTVIDLERTVILDTERPITPLISSMNNYSNKNKMKISGQAETGTAVRCSVLGFNSSKEYVSPVIFCPMVEGRDEGADSFQITVNLTEGVNTVSIVSVDNAGNKSATSNPVIIIYDPVAPGIMIAGHRTFIRPYMGEIMTVSYNLSEPVNELVTLLLGGVTLNTIQSGQEINGEKSFQFDGKFNGTMLPAGVYTFKFQIIDQAGNRSGELTTFNIYEKMEAGLACHDFTPNGDGLLDEVSVSWSITAGSGHYRQTLELVNKAGPENQFSGIVSLCRGEQVTDNLIPQSFNFIWNGAGVADGEYTLQLSVIDLITGEQQLITKSMTIASTIPTVSTREENIAFSPNGDGIQDLYAMAVTVDLSSGITAGDRLSHRVSANYSIVNEARQVVYSLTRTYEKNDEFLWNGRGNNGNIVPDGRYQVILQVADILGNKMNSLVSNIIVDTVKPMKPVLCAIDAFTSINVVQVSAVAEAGSTVRCSVLSSPGSQEAQYLLCENDFHITVNLTEGENTICVASIDNAGNESATSNPVSIIYDPAAPEIVGIEYSDETPVKAGELIITINFSEELNALPDIRIVKPNLELLPIEVRKSGKKVISRFIIPASLTPQTINQEGGLEGNNILVIRNGKDFAVNSMSAVSCNIIIDTVTPELLSLTYTPCSPIKSGELKITALYSEPLVDIPDISIVSVNTVLRCQSVAHNGGQLEYTFDIPEERMDGICSVSIGSANDFSGNGSAISLNHLLIDTLRPELTTYSVWYSSDPNGVDTSDLKVSPLDINEYLVRSGYLWVKAVFSEDIDCSLLPFFKIYNDIPCDIVTVNPNTIMARARIDEDYGEKDTPITIAGIVDSAGNGMLTHTLMDGVPDKLKIDTTPPEIISFNNPDRPGNNCFSPDGDGLDDTLRIFIEISESAYIRSLAVFDENDRLIRTIARDEVFDKGPDLNGCIDFVWDGTDDQGITRNEKAYYKLVLDSADFAGNNARTVSEKLIKIEQVESSFNIPDSGAVSVSSQSISHNPFSPLVQKLITFVYKFDENTLYPVKPLKFGQIDLLSVPGTSNMRIKLVREFVENDRSEIVAVLHDWHPTVVGAVTVTWNGEGRGTDGTYAFCVEGKDYFDKKSQFALNLPFIVDTSMPGIYNLSLNTDYISPSLSVSVQDRTTVSFSSSDVSTWSASLSVNVDILTSTNSPVRRIFDGSCSNGNTINVNWDGRDDRSYVADGWYHIRVSATDKAENTISSHKDICVDNTLPDVQLKEGPFNYIKLVNNTTPFYLVSSNIQFYASCSDTNLKNYWIIATTANSTVTLSSGALSQSVQDIPFSCATGNLGLLGQWDINAFAQDKAGNIASGNVIRIVVDTVCDGTPTFSINNWNKYVTQNYVSIAAGATDMNGIGYLLYSLNGGSWQSVLYNGTTTNFTVNLSTEGFQTMSLKAVDKAGNVSSPATSQSIIYDKTAPDVSITSSTHPSQVSWSNNTSVTVKFNGTDTSGISGYYYRFQKDTASGMAYTNSDTVSKGLDNGIWTVYVKAVDNAGNISAQASYFCNIDTQKPVIPGITSPTHADTWSSNRNCTVRYSVDNDGFSPFDHYETAVINTGNSQEINPQEINIITNDSYSFTVSNGTQHINYFYVRAVDQAGNIGDWYGKSFKVDTVSPNIPTDLSCTINTTSMVFNAVAINDNRPNDPATLNYEYELDDGPIIGPYNATYQYSLADLKENSLHTLRARSVDDVGNRSPWFSMGCSTLIHDPAADELIIETKTATSITIKPALKDSNVENKSLIRYNIIYPGGGNGGDGSSSVPYTSSYTDTGLRSNCQYGYQIQYINSDGKTTAASPVLSQYTLPCDPRVTCPATNTWYGPPNGGALVFSAIFGIDNSNDYYYLLTEGPSVPVDAINNAWTSGQLTFTDLTSAAGYYLHIVGRNVSGNKGSPASFGRFKWDATPPSVTALSINSNAGQYTNTLNVSTAFNYADTHSGVARYFLSKDNINWTETALNPTQSSGTAISACSLASGQDGLRTVFVKVVDDAGNSTVTSASITYDKTSPAGTLAVNNGQPYTKTANVILNAANMDASGISANMELKNENSSNYSAFTYDSAKEWILSSGDGTKTVFSRIYDNAGNYLSISDTIILDTTKPAITMVDVPSVYNNFLYDNHLYSATFNVNDANSINYVTLSILDVNNNIIKSFYNNAIISNQNIAVTWNGTDDNGDYVDDGTYTIRIVDTDAAGNTTENISAISVNNVLDVYVTGNILDHLSVGCVTDNIVFESEYGADFPSLIAAVYSFDTNRDWDYDTVSFTLNSTQRIYFNSSNSDIAYSYVEITDNNGTNFLLDWNFYNTTLTLPRNVYTIKTSCIRGKSSSSGSLTTTAYAKKIMRNTLLIPGLQNSTLLTSGIKTNGDYLNITDHFNYRHSVSINSVGNILYKRSNDGVNWSNSIVLNTINNYCTVNPVIVEIPSYKGVYVAYIHKNIANDYSIKLKLIPNKFRPLAQAGVGYSSVKQPVLTISVPTADSRPFVIAPPASGDLDSLVASILKDKELYNGGIVKTTKPTFVWQMPAFTPVDSTYKLAIIEESGNMLSQEPFETACANYVIDIRTGDYKNEASLYYYTLGWQDSLPESREGSRWRWQIEANMDTASDNAGYVRSKNSKVFQVLAVPEIEQSINYPNPFEHRTTIRYKLSQDADRVKIYIFTIAGRLVTVLDGDTDGTSPAKEYNDAAWNGENDLGEEVVNGVYIYKIEAKINGRATNAQGKMIKLR